MLVNSLQYTWLILLIAVINYFLPQKVRLYFILLISLTLIGITHYTFLYSISVVIFITYASGILLISKHEQKRKLVFIVAVSLNVLLLCYFKYNNYFIDNYFYVKEMFGQFDQRTLPPILFPLGISYYVFQSISYLIEVYWKKEKTEENLVRLAIYLSFFPKVVAGPIERSRSFLTQLKNYSLPLKIDFQIGLQLILWGLFKKMVIADRLNIITNEVFNTPTDYSGWPLIGCSILLIIQLYADLSGYTDMALGSARLLGFKLTDNFNRPFTATSVSDFWRRWHISLSSWVADYIYRPLSLYFSVIKGWSTIGIVMALFISFAILGIWHGDQVTFLIFGLLQGIAISFEFLFKSILKKLIFFKWIYKTSIISTTLTLAFFTFSCIFFRANNLKDAHYIITHLFCDLNLNWLLEQIDIAFVQVWISVVLTGLFVFLDMLIFKNGIVHWFQKRSLKFELLTYTILFFVIILFSAAEDIPFIYQRF